MSRDLKKPRSRQPSTARKSSGGTLLGLFIGLVLGVVIAAGVVWYIYRTPTPITTTAQTSPSDKAAEQPVTPAPLPGKPGEAVPPANDRPSFDFYKILPGGGEPGVQEAPADTRGSEAKPEKDNALKEPAFLQVGSFQNSGDADNQKAKLAMNGIEASVQQVMLLDKVWYRVRVGPFTRNDELTRMRGDLARMGFDAAIVRKD